MLTTEASENPRLCEHEYEHQERSSLFVNILILGSTHRRGMKEDNIYKIITITLYIELELE